MAKSNILTAQQLELVSTLHDSGKSIRAIAAQLEIGVGQVRTVLSKKINAETQQKIAALVSKPVVKETTKSVFDIMNRLEECLQGIDELAQEEETKQARLDHRVSVLTERRMLVAEARATLESIYNIRVLNDFITEVTAILEGETPGAKQRIFKRLEASTGANAAIGLFASNPHN